MLWNRVEREIFLTEKSWSSTSVFHCAWKERWPNIRFTLTYRWWLMCWPVGVLGTWEEQDGKTSDKEVRWEKLRKESLEVDWVWRYLCFVEYFPENKMICPWMSASFPGACWKDSVTVRVCRLSMWAVVQTSLLHCWVHKLVRAEASAEPFPAVLVGWPLFPAPVHRLQPHYWLTFPSSWKREEGMDLRNTDLRGNDGHVDVAGEWRRKTEMTQAFLFFELMSGDTFNVIGEWGYF